MTQVMSKAKWFVPVIVIVAMLAAVGVVWSQSGSGSGGLGDIQTTDFNPGYESVVVAASESSMPVVLYSITVDPPSAVVPVGGGDMATVVVTNLIPEVLANVPMTIVQNGDLTGDITVTAEVYTPVFTTGVVSWTAPVAPVAVVTFAGVTVHPGLTVTATVPVIPALAAAGSICFYKAEFLNVVGP